MLISLAASAAGWAQQSEILYLPIVTSPNEYQIRHGDATYYFATGAGACTFDPSPNDLMVAALNSADYGTADLCGAFVEVTGPDGSVVVRIVDHCPDCLADGDIDLSIQAFAYIAEVHLGRVPATWRVVSPDIAGNIIYHFKDSSNPWWTAIQIRNHRNPIALVEYQDQNGVYQSLPRTMYNYFVANNGLGAGPYNLRVTDVYGNIIADDNIPLVENGDVVSHAQFPPAP